MSSHAATSFLGAWLRPPPTRPTLVPLGEVKPRALRAVLEHERRCWRAALDWDFSHTAALIRRSLENQTLGGYALVTAGRVLGYVYYIPSPDRSLIGSVHVTDDGDAGHAAARRLVERAVTDLVRDVRATRVESQHVYFGDEPLDEVFADWGFRRYPRCFLSGSVPELRARLSSAAAGVEGSDAVTSFDDLARGAVQVDGTAAAEVALDHAAEVIYRSFAGTVELEVSASYHSVEACREFVDGIAVRHGCGRFDRRASFVAGRAGNAAAVLLVSDVGRKTAHIAQLSVAPDAQRRGLGRRLLRAALDSLTARGYDKVTLAVTTGNRRAYRWYRDLGFTVAREFAAYAWSRSGGYCRGDRFSGTDCQ